MKKREQPPWLRNLKRSKPTGWRARKLSLAAGEKLPPTGHRRNWAVEKLPPDIRKIVFDGYVTGKSYRQIRVEVAAQGHAIGESALSHYWRECWSRESNDLYRARLQAEILTRQAQQEGSPNLAALVRELLWLNLIQRRHELQEQDLMQLLQAAREQEKVRIAAHKAGLQDAPQEPMTREEMRRRISEIYGWPALPAPSRAEGSEAEGPPEEPTAPDQPDSQASDHQADEPTQSNDPNPDEQSNPDDAN